MYYIKPFVHYNLDFLTEGEYWRPKKDAWRFNRYEQNRVQFETSYTNELYQLYPTGMLVFADNYDRFTELSKLLGYPKLITMKTIDMVMGEPPVILKQTADETIDSVRDIRSCSGFNSALKQGLIDYSRYGVALLRVFKDNKGRAKITAWDPQEWVPVFYDDGTNRIHFNVLGWIVNDNLLKIQIHDTEDGSYEERLYEYSINDAKIGRLKESARYNSTGHKLFYAIINTPTTSNPIGTGDYDAINPLLQKAIERLTAILRVLDEHADPSMIGPHTLLSRSDNGELVFKTSKYYAVGNEETKPEYLTWEANLDSSFKAFEKLMEQIYILSEMGPAFIGAGNTGNVVSGTAMRYKMISPLEKARRIQNDLTEPLKELFASILTIDGVKSSPEDINIAWKDPLPKDPREVAELTKVEAGTAAVKPLKHAIMDNYDVDESTAEEYIEEIYETLEKMSKVSGSLKDAETDDNRTSGNSLNDSRKKGSPSDPTYNQNTHGAE